MIWRPFGNTTLYISGLARAITPLVGEATLVADVPLGTGDAPIVFLGDWVGWLCLAGLVLFIFFVPLDTHILRVKKRDAAGEGFPSGIRFYAISIIALFQLSGVSCFFARKAAQSGVKYLVE